MQPLAIGIDLGTTNSVIAYVNADGRPEVIRNAEGKSTTPSVIYFGADPPLVGDQAKEMQCLGETEVAAFFKRSMGDTNFLMHLGGKDRTAVDLSALVLERLKSDAEKALGREISQSVISVPAYFNNAQREATIEAGRRAGLQVLQIINEPTAAALAYRVQDSSRGETVFVYDLGGGTFDVTLVEASREELKVIGTSGDHNLGGKDWDSRIASHLAAKFAENHGLNPLDDHASLNELLARCEEAKKTLSARETTRVSIQYEGRRETFELTRATFAELTKDLMERTRSLCEQSLADVGMKWNQLTGVLLVGGSTRMPMVSEYVHRMSGRPPMTGVNVDDAVALGAATLAARKLYDNAPGKRAFGLPPGPRARDVMSHSLGMIAVSTDRTQYINSIIVPKNQPVPCQVSRPYQLRTQARGGNEAEVYVTQGEMTDPSACSLLGKYRFTEIEHSAGAPCILDIVYAYDESGVVNVSATQRSTGRALPMTVDPVPSDLSWLSQPPEQPAEQVHVTAYLAFDLSGSMAGNPLAEAKAAAFEFLRQTDLAHSSIGLVSFADTVQPDIHVSQDARRFEAEIKALEIGSVGYGNSASPFRQIHEALRSVQGPRFIIVLTDGVWSHQAAAISEARACHQDGIEVIAIGFGGADRNFLRQIASAEKDSFFAQRGELVGTITKIAQELTETSGRLGLAAGTSRALKAG